MLLKEIGAFIAAHIEQNPEHAELEVKFGFYPAMNDYEEPHLEIEVVKYLRIKIVGEYRYQISNERNKPRKNK